MMPCQTRLHLQHGPIDLIIGADGPLREAAFRAAELRFETVLEEIMTEIETLRAPIAMSSERPEGQIARQMFEAVHPYASSFVTPMAAVAGAVADTILYAMRRVGPLPRAYVNNGGDIALHLAEGQRFKSAISRHDRHEIGRIDVGSEEGIGGMATSGRHGRSLSLGIADSVTTLARSAAEADAAATLIANAVDLPAHPAIQRKAAQEVDPDSDLGDIKVVTGCAPLSASEISAALKRGAKRANQMREEGRITAVALHLQDQTCVLGSPFQILQRSPAYA